METANSILARAEGLMVTVQLRDRQLRGKLAVADDFINLVLDDVEELGPRGTLRVAGPVVVRGSQVAAIHAAKLGPPVAAPRVETVWSGARANRGGYYPLGRDAGDRGWAWRRE